MAGSSPAAGSTIAGAARTQAGSKPATTLAGNMAGADRSNGQPTGTATLHHTGTVPSYPSDIFNLLKDNSSKILT